MELKRISAVPASIWKQVHGLNCCLTGSHVSAISRSALGMSVGSWDKQTPNSGMREGVVEILLFRIV